MTSRKQPQLLVVGGGISGLIYAWYAQRAGAKVHVVEAGPALGGAVGTHEIAGMRLNSGAEAFAVTSPAVPQLLEALGIGESIVWPNPAGAWGVTDAGANPLPDAATLGIPTSPLAADVRRIIGLPAALRAWAERFLPAGYGLREGVTLGEYVRRRMGGKVLTHLVEPVVGGVHAADPNLLELDAISPRLRGLVKETGSLAAAAARLRPQRQAAGSAIASLKPSMGALVDTLAQQIVAAGGKIDTSSRVEGLQALPTGGYGYSVNGEQHICDASVFAVGPAQARELLAPLNAEAARAIPETPLSGVRLVTLVLDAPQLKQKPRGNGALVAAHVKEVRAKALTHATAKWRHLAELAEGREVVRLSYGRNGEALPDESEFPALALADASRILGVPLDETHLVAHRVTTWPGTLGQARSGHSEALREFGERLSATPRLDVTGAWRAGTGIAAITAFGREQARQLVERIIKGENR
ncbi:protoporphyrinogen oxidase [Dermabacteraceae bacterium P9123]